MIKILLLLTFLLSTNLFAHSGRTNINGCHIDKSTNVEHCHETTNDTMVKNGAEKIIEPNEHDADASQSNFATLENSADKSEEKVEQKSSSSKFSATLSAFYFILVIVLIFVFNNVLKTTIELFNVINEKLESKTKFTIAISIFFTAITVILVFLLVRGVF
ncbi:MAG: hypothetical protein WBI40_00550 [Methylococcaceae bacterium]